ncbi:MAG: RidA family protein [Lautropia sp.]
MTTAIPRNPAALGPPAGISHHGVEVTAGRRMLFVSGQIGVRADGSIPESIAEQTEVVWQRIEAILAESGMAISDIVKITSFLTRPEDYEAFARVRAARLAGHRTASTAVFVSALVKPALRVEIEVVAARSATGGGLSSAGSTI